MFMVSRSAIRRMLIVVLTVGAALTAGAADRKAAPPFPEIKGKFGSKTLSCRLVGEFIDYDGRVQVTFDEGTLYSRRETPANDHYFLGRGTLRVIDTSGLDAGWYNHFGKRFSLNFVSAYMCAHNLPFLLGLDTTGRAQAKIGREAWQKLQFLVTAPDRYFGVSLSGEPGIWPNGRFFPLPVWVDMELETGEQVVLYLSPDVTEQLNIFLYDKKFDAPYLLGGFDLNRLLNIQPVMIDSTVIRLNLQEDGRFTAASDIFFAEGADPRGVKLSLPSLFTVDSVIDGSGGALATIKKKLRTNLYIGPRMLSAGRVDRMSVYYHGRFAKAASTGIDLPADITTWFPHLPYRNLGRYTIQYTLHKDLTLISVGAKIDERVIKDKRTVTYRTGEISYVSFASGVYDTLQDSAQGVPLTLYLRKENNQGLFNRNIPRAVLSDLAEAFSFFHGKFGPPLARSLRVVDQPWATGQSSPGLIHLSELTFVIKRDQARFRAHEVAHQWWGHTAVPKSYREMWLSEGLAEYSASRYLLDVKHDTTAYHELIAHWRRQVLQEGKINGSYSRGYRAGPIVLGARLLQSYSPGDYVALVYYKAAYVLQMMQFEIDGPAYRTDFFSNLLAEYCRTYFERQATTLDFMKLAEHYLGAERAASFMHQWLDGWKIPSFTCGYSIIPDGKGRPLVKINIAVSGVDPGFETPYPVKIHFNDGTSTLFRLDGIGVGGEHQLGPFPQGVAKVEFDPDHIILSAQQEVVGR